MASATRNFTTGNFQLKLDGIDAGFLKSIDGGAISAEVIHDPHDPSRITKKHVGAPRYEEFAIQIGLRMGSVVYEWIQAAWALKVARKNGSIVAYDANLQARSEREFENAVITEVAFPKMDGALKDPCYMTLTFAPGTTRTKQASGKAPPTPKGKEAWLSSGFRLEIPGLDCSKVSAIDSFSVTQANGADTIGDTRDPPKEPGTLEFPNLAIRLAESSAATWMDWFDDFVIKGNNDDDREKSGSLILLSPDQTELGRINFFNLGIFRIAPARTDAGDEKVQRVTAELYCERMELQVNKPGKP